MENSAAQPTGESKPAQIAPLWHTLGLLIILLAFVWATFRWQSHSLAAGEQHHGNALHYLFVIASEWAMAMYIWLGGLVPGAARLRDIIGGRWMNLRQVLRDVAIAAGFWIVFEGVGALSSFVGRPSHAGSLQFVNPLGAIEVTLWVVMSMTSGFCEELVFRGYFQKQFLALTRSAAFAVLGQAVLFGICHWYQGVKQVILISVLGALFGILAQWRKSLRPGMIAHAWADVFNVIPTPFR
jgi:membrane protease YdiL (CAAX protease family)